MPWNNVKYAVWQNAVGELCASLHPAQWALERTHSRGGWWSPADLLRGIVLNPSPRSACSCSNPWVSHIKGSILTCCVLPMPSGFMLNDQVQHSIVIRYACSKLTIDFDGFVACMIRLETLFSKCLHSSAKGNSWKNFGVSLSIWCLLTVNVANCMEMWGCQQNCVCWRKQQRNRKSLSVWMTLESGGHVFITYHALLLYSHLHFMVSALAPKLSQLL